jgi:hypothetical protein
MSNPVITLGHHCKDCFFFAQEWHLDWTRDEGGEIQMFIELDKYCRLCDIFKKPEGFCDMYEPEGKTYV